MVSGAASLGISKHPEGLSSALWPVAKVLLHSDSRTDIVPNNRALRNSCPAFNFFKSHPLYFWFISWYPTSVPVMEFLLGRSELAAPELHLPSLDPCSLQPVSSTAFRTSDGYLPCMHGSEAEPKLIVNRTCIPSVFSTCPTVTLTS
jgi:hypothetical protein